ncbi:single-stranded DNA-binding protein [Actinomyces sp. 594]|uniref:single-stranded DNA-binding protein n=1 Tax=Actinomyces sp. 594 TaxID=2057793 RepID=UPI001C571386|nr:single-stranded DNA-binding protein [Actinomyces sp. 594]MBW3069664.1 single-stranded DNA-binding protein [Actinomyces sp. 594]
MSRQLDLVVQGVLGTNPAVTRTSGGRAYCYFRLATSPSFRTAQGWRDGQTIWFTAKAWGALAENLGRSLHKGDPVVLVGRFTQENWSKGSEEFSTNVLTVSCGGHDLTRGESRFMRIVHRSDTEDDGDAATSEASTTTSSGSAGSAQSAGSAPSPDAAGLPAPTPAPSAGLPAPTPAPSAGLPEPAPTPVADPVMPGQAAPPLMTPASEPNALDYVLADEQE